MDIEFIEEEHRDNVFKLMELCGIDMKEAYELYMNSNFSLERAMQMHFNQSPSHQSQFNQYEDSHQSGLNNYPSYNNQQEGDQFDTLYQKYKVYKQTGRKFQQNYQVRKQHGFLGGIGKLFKGTPQSNFKKQLEQYFGRTCPIQFSANSLSETLATSDKFPVIIYFVDFSPANKAKLEQILRSNQVSEIVNVQFKNFGLDTNYDVQKSLQKFVDRKRYNNCLLVLRVNAVQQVQVITNIPLLGSNLKQVIEKLRLAKNSCISKDFDDAHLERRFNEQLMGNFDYQKPMSIAQKRKIAQDRQIRKMQEQQFQASMKVQQQKQRKNSQNNEAYTNKGGQKPQTVPSNTYQTHNSQPATKVQAPKRNLPEQRQQLRNKLKVYTQGMNIKLRLPDGESTVLTVGMDEKVKYLYDYVMSIDKQIGFEKDADRKFNIVRPYDRLNLTQLQNKSLRQVFEGSQSQMLVVGETE